MSLSAFRYPLLLVLCVVLQYGFWQHSHEKLPDMTVVPTPPSKEVLDVMSFGDGEFLFRSMAFMLGNAGDTFGRVTPLYKYDMEKMYTWFSLLDHYNAESNLLPSLASYYYSQTQRREDVRHLIRYLQEHAKRDLEQKWWWLVQATYLALHRVEDTDLAVTTSAPLAHAENVPVNARQLPAIVHEQRGEFGDALYIMDTILQSAEEIPDDDMRFMNIFIRERIQKMDELSEESRQRLQHDQQNAPSVLRIK